MRFIPLLSLLFLSGCSVFGIRGGYEESAFSVLTSDGDFTVRRYPPRLVAQVSMAKDEDDAFRLLFRYISGANLAQSDISMTVPVATSSGKIAMTVPLATSRDGAAKEMMQFFLPSSFTLESAPKPTDPRVSLALLPESVVAAVRFSGFTGDETLEKEGRRLRAWASARGWTPSSPEVLFRYDPPFTIPFLRRNELIVPVERR